MIRVDRSLQIAIAKWIDFIEAKLFYGGLVNE